MGHSTRALHPRIVADIQRLAADGLTPTVIARRLEISKDSVYRYRGERSPCWDRGCSQTPRDTHEGQCTFDRFYHCYCDDPIEQVTWGSRWCGRCYRPFPRLDLRAKLLAELG